MQRPGAKKPPERALLSAETVNAQNRPQGPRRNGLFSIDGGFRGSGRLGGGRTRARTWDPLIKSQLLYQLSYAPGRARKAFARGRRLAKRPPNVQQTGGIFPGHRHGHSNEKAAGIQRLFLMFRSIG